VSHPDRAKMTLLIYHTNIEAEDADLLLSSVAMNLLMEENMEVGEGPEIVLVGDLSEAQWSVLIPQLWGRIKLEHEHQDAIYAVDADQVTSLEMDDIKKID
ncbi:MAG: hypothetical protein J7524_01365, partial [Roseofilum sp. Belize BBD 4]